MRFHYCPDCGAKLSARVLGDEGPVPWCEACRKPLFDVFPVCIIALVVNEYGEAALLRQGEAPQRYGSLVSGYMQPGETAETAARREIGEELGLAAEALQFAGTYWFGKKEMLMVGFIASARRQEFRLSVEVQSAEWVPADRALAMVHPKGSVSYALLERYLAGGAPAESRQEIGQKEGEPCLS